MPWSKPAAESPIYKICHAHAIPIMSKREAMYRYECPVGDPAQDVSGFVPSFIGVKSLFIYTFLL